MKSKIKSFQTTTHSINTLHFELVRALFQNGRIYINERGSFVGHKRLEYDFVTGIVTSPTEDTIPQMPTGIPAVSTLEDNTNYAATHLFSSEVAENETYTYGEFISPQLPKIIDMLKVSPDTNQATIMIGNENSIDQEHPPCLRIIDFRSKLDSGARELHMFVYFRSWDLWSGLPVNLGGMAILMEYVANSLGIGIGEMIIMSKGLHLYDFTWPMALARLGGNLPEGSVVTRVEAELGESWKDD